MQMKITRIAMPVWMGRVSPVFDSARKLLVVHVIGAREVARTVIMIDELTAPLRVRILTASGIDALVCGAISRNLANMISAGGIKVYSFVTGDVEEVLRAHLSRTCTVDDSNEICLG
jgi:predicted Fe-Mo cluster-binding NifX family protein